MPTIGNSAAGEGNEGLDGGSIRLTRFQMPEPGTITAIENYIATYSAPTDYYALIYRGDSSGPTTVAYASSLITAAPANAVASHTLSSSITATSGEYLWAGNLCIAGGSSYRTDAGGSLASKAASSPEDPLTGEGTEGGYSYSVALVYTAGGGGDTTPDSFTFTDVTNATLSTQYTSNTITVAGIDTAATISISGGSGTYSINGGSYTASSGTVNNGDTVAVRVTSSGSNSTAVTTTLTIGGVSDTYSVTTVAAGAVINSYPATVRSGETGIAYTTTGLSAVSSITIGSLAATSVSDTSGDGTHSIPPLTDETAHELYGTKTVTINGAGGSPTTSTSFQPPSGMDFVTLSGTINDTETGAVFEFDPVAVVGDQLVKSTSLGIDAQANITGEAGVYTVWHIQASTKIARSYTLTLGVAGVTATPSGVQSTSAIGSPTLSFGSTISATGVQSSSAIGTVTALAGVTATPAGVQSTTQTGAPTISAGATVAAIGVQAASAISNPLAYSGSGPQSIKNKKISMGIGIGNF